VQSEPSMPTPARRRSGHTLRVASSEQDRALASFAVYLRVEKALLRSPSAPMAGPEDLGGISCRPRQDGADGAARDMKELLEHLLGHGMDSRTIARKLSALRGFYRYLLLDKLIAHDPTLDIDSPKQWKVLPKALSEEETSALIESPAHGTPLRGNHATRRPWRCATAPCWKFSMQPRCG